MARRSDKQEGPRYYTTHQVAKFLGVSLPTVVNWVNSGLLGAHKTPGGHRRIARDHVIAFARDNNYPISRELLLAGSKVARVLVVDDEPDFSTMVRDYLVLKGELEVEVAESGFEAGYTVAHFRPHLILMDLMMPDMDGFDVLRMLRDQDETRHVPVIACTAYRDAKIDAKLGELRFDGLVEKPLSLSKLLSLIERTLNLSEG